jgi:hypothetical protein
MPALRCVTVAVAAVMLMAAATSVAASAENDAFSGRWRGEVVDVCSNKQLANITLEIVKRRISPEPTAAADVDAAESDSDGTKPAATAQEMPNVWQAVEVRAPEDASPMKVRFELTLEEPTAENEGEEEKARPRSISLALAGTTVPGDTFTFGGPVEAGFGVSVRHGSKAATWTTTNGTLVAISVPGSRFKKYVQGGDAECAEPRTVIFLRKDTIESSPWYQQPWVIIVFFVGFFWVKLFSSYRSANKQLGTQRKIDATIAAVVGNEPEPAAAPTAGKSQTRRR